MGDKPMKWALKGTGTWTPGEEPTDGELAEAANFQRAAEPILAVVRACYDNYAKFGCLVCRQEEVFGKRCHTNDCPVPAALEAMEVPA